MSVIPIPSKMDFIQETHVSVSKHVYFLNSNTPAGNSKDVSQSLHVGKRHAARILCTYAIEQLAGMSVTYD